MAAENLSVRRFKTHRGSRNASCKSWDSLALKASSLCITLKGMVINKQPPQRRPGAGSESPILDSTGPGGWGTTNTQWESRLARRPHTDA
jgi:hypothetical protein